MSPERAIHALALGQTLVWAGLYYIFPALILSWEADLGWSRGVLSLALTLAVGTAALASPLAGRLIDRGHGRAVLAGSALGGAVLLAALPAAGTVAAFHALWIGIGLAMAGCLYEPCFAFVARARGAAARRGITTITLVAGFASTLAFPLAGGIAEAAGWRAAAWLFAALIAGIAVPAFWLAGGVLERAARRGPAAAPAAPAAPMRRILRRRAFLLVAFAFAAIALIHGIVINHLLPILDGRGVGREAALLAAAMIGPMQVAGRLAMMAGEQRLPARAIATLSFAGLAAASLALAGSAAPVLLALFVLLQGAAYGVAAILKPVLVAEVLGPADLGAKIGLMAVPYLAASALAPFAGALLWQAVGYDAMLAMTAGLAVLALAAFRAALARTPADAA